MPAADSSVIDNHLDRSTQALADEYRGMFSRETVARLVKETYAGLSATAQIAGYLPLLTERFARDRLRALGQADGLIVKTRLEVLFVCVHNSGRSQMAAALLRRLSDDSVAVRSAGSRPSADIDPTVREAMREVGVDLAQAFPKPMTDEVVRAADVVITMGCGDACPVYPGKRYADWEVDDPAGRDLETVRGIRDEIERRVQALLTDLRADGR